MRVYQVNVRQNVALPSSILLKGIQGSKPEKYRTEKRTKGKEKACAASFAHLFAQVLLLSTESCLAFLLGKDQYYSHLC
jgi:hypothetical protein